MSDFIEANQTVSNQMACSTCGAILSFKPGTDSLVCGHCGAHNQIAQPPAAPGRFEEISLEDWLAANHDQEEKMEVATVNCNACGAVVTMEPNVSSDKCPFCASNLVIAGGTISRLHRPQYVLPFRIDGNAATSHYRNWIGSLWFAPNDLKQNAGTAKPVTGMYLPYWTFDCTTDTRYTGQRGEWYWETEYYETEEDGKRVTRSRQVRKTRWYHASGMVYNEFDDLLIEATRSLNLEKLRELEPWDLPQLVPYDDKYLSGFRTETYVVDVKSGFGMAKERMVPVIASTIRRDIGGDEQIINQTQSVYHDPTFKHILLPVWISAYRYQGKVYQFIVNARTGEVQGERPWSVIKIVLAILLVLILAFFALLFLSAIAAVTKSMR
ncbi:hypothetical protein DB346_25075 [Verrucomicrobia bacterium LW23]|nr:hypothetical protein DB346_25075 [Verrucomicrobia bacterium LW23]